MKSAPSAHDGVYVSVIPQTMIAYGAVRRVRDSFSPFFQEAALVDLIYLAGGLGVLLLFVGYAVLLKRA
jgi:hypothetical protein